jgi:hypothetical protein
MTANAVRSALLENGGPAAELPGVRTFSNILNRQDYRLRAWKDPRSKKMPCTDAIFANVKRENSAADADPASVRLSLDTKAVINLGPYSRGGLSRGLRPVAAADHDLMTKQRWCR